MQDQRPSEFQTNAYRQYIEEAHPDNEVNPAETKHELFKIVVIKNDESFSVRSKNFQ